MKLAMLSNMLHRIRVVEQKLTKKFEDNMGFSLTRYQILMFLKDNGDKLQIDIANYIGIDPAAITRHIKILEEKGYITRKRSESNGREIVVSLTNFAKDELEKCHNNNHSKESLGIYFDNSEIEELTNILEKIENKI